jgi:DNA modification methylase
MSKLDFAVPKERMSKIVHFRLPASASEQLIRYLDPAKGLFSIHDVARKFTTEALAQRKLQRLLTTFNAADLKGFRVFEGDSSHVLSDLPARTFRACVTSPPFWRQRDYNHPNQLGQERDPDVYIHRLADILTEVRRLLTDDGTLWVNLDDSYYNKRLMGIPWRLALELQRRGWYWRAEIVWTKASTPEAVKDRPTRAHEPVLLFSKRQRYFYDFEAILEPHDNQWALDCIKKARVVGEINRPKNNPFSKDERRANGTRGNTRAQFGMLMNPAGKNRRDVWAIKAEKSRSSHSAVMPVSLAEICIRAATQTGDLVLDPFCGTGTTGVAALRYGRRFVGVDLLKEFVAESDERIKKVMLQVHGNYQIAEL